MRQTTFVFTVLSFLSLTWPLLLGHAQIGTFAFREPATGARCMGLSPCTACTNCSRCGWCNGGGICGICGGGSSSTSAESDYESIESPVFPRKKPHWVKQPKAVPAQYIRGQYYRANMARRYRIIPNLDRIGGCPPSGLAPAGHPLHAEFVKQSVYRPSSEYKYIPFQTLLTDDLDGLSLTDGDSIFTYAYIADVSLMKGDSCNCYGKTDARRNTSINFVEEPESDDGIIGIITPRVKVLRQANGLPHSTRALKKLRGKWVCVTGILTADTTVSTNAQWKIHPVIDVEVWEESVEVEGDE